MSVDRYYMIVDTLSNPMFACLTEDDVLEIADIFCIHEDCVEKFEVLGIQAAAFYTRNTPISKAQIVETLYILFNSDEELVDVEFFPVWGAPRRFGCKKACRRRRVIVRHRGELTE
jgi:hypothetical protein